TITLAATASANATRVDFYCDNATSPLGSATSLPFSYACDTTTMANGSHTFYCKAYDALGNSATSTNVTVTVNNGSVTVTYPWAKSFGGSSSDAGQAVTTDNSGNFYMAGYFASSSLDFGNGTGALTGTGSQRMFVVKFNAAGVAQWSKGFGGSGSISVNTIK